MTYPRTRASLLLRMEYHAKAYGTHDMSDWLASWAAVFNERDYERADKLLRSVWEDEDPAPSLSSMITEHADDEADPAPLDRAALDLGFDSKTSTYGDLWRLP